MRLLILILLMLIVTTPQSCEQKEEYCIEFILFNNAVYVYRNEWNQRYQTRLLIRVNNQDYRFNLD